MNGQSPAALDSVEYAVCYHLPNSVLSTCLFRAGQEIVSQLSNTANVKPLSQCVAGNQCTHCPVCRYLDLPGESSKHLLVPTTATG